MTTSFSLLRIQDSVRFLCCLIFSGVVAIALPLDVGIGTSDATSLAARQLAAGVQVTILTDKVHDPDDMALDGQGGLLVSSLSLGQLLRVDLRQKNKPARTIATGLAAPEGIVVLPNGTLMVAEQKANRVTTIDKRGRRHMLIALPNTTGRDGIDGLERDSRRGDLLIPDSPHGVVWALPINGAKGGSAVRLPGSYVRPVDAIATQDGAIVVADEYGNALWRIDPTWHAVSRLAGIFAMPDDLAVDSTGTIYVTSLGDGTLKAIDRQGRISILVSGLHDPQGLVIAHDDTHRVQLFVSEETADRIVSVSMTR